MAKGKKGKQKQDFIQPQPQTTTVPLAALPEEPPKVYDDGVSGMMEMGHGGFPDEHLSTKAGSSPAAWPSASLAATAWGTNVSHESHPMKTAVKEQKSSTASKSVNWAGGWEGNDAGWGGGAADGWGGGIPEEDEEDEEYGDEEWDEEEEQEWEQEELGWGPTTNASSWGVQPTTLNPSKSQPTQPGWKSWGKEVSHLSKVPSIAATTPVVGASKPNLSHQQHSQILNSLLSQPSSQNGYLAAAQQQQKLRQQQPAVNPYHQKPMPHPKQTAGAFAAAPPSQWPSYSKKEKKSQNEPPRHQRSQSEYQDTWGAASTGIWGKDSSGKGNDTGVRAKDYGGWGKDSVGWENDAGGRSKDVGDWGEDSVGWENGAGEWGTASGWGPIPEEDEEDYEEDDRRVHFTSRSSKGGGGWGSESFAPSARGSESSKVSIANLWGSDKPRDTSYTMPSKTLAHAYNGTTTSLNTGLPRNKINEYTNVQFHESKGAALMPAQQALFGRARKAKDRIHWMFPPNKDERVESLLAWIETVSRDLGTYGLHKFLQSRERGALIANADYRIPGGKNEPAFDWLTFDHLQETRDKIMQESAAFYDPTAQAIIFVFLPSQSGNSVAMWRRKINVPNNMRLMLQAEISLALAALRREEDYVVHVDEYPRSQPTQIQKQSGSSRRLRRASLPSRTEYADAYPMIIEEPGKPKKKRKWWQFFRVDW